MPHVVWKSAILICTREHVTLGHDALNIFELLWTTDEQYAEHRFMSTQLINNLKTKEHTENNLNFISSQSSTIWSRSGRLPSSLSVRNKCFPVLPTIKCAVSDALRSRKGKPHRKGSWWNNLNMRLTLLKHLNVFCFISIWNRSTCSIWKTKINF